MTFLPIAVRELRIAARSKGARRVRVWTTLISIFTGAVFLFFSGLMQSRGAGGIFFVILSAYAFGLCLLAGVFITADCLSEEKRAGTLGLLFLTNLKGYDVVLGKFVARGLNPLLALMAVLPVISLGLIMGGVTVAEFWRVSLALANTLFLSLAAGICVSAWSRDAQKASGATLGLLVLLTVALPIGEHFLSRTIYYSGAIHVASWFSPYTSFTGGMARVYDVQPEQFWNSMMATNALGWLLLIAATLKTHTAWQDRKPSVERKPLFGTGRPQRKGRLEGDPVRWLLAGGIGLRLALWGIAFAWALFSVGLVVVASGTVDASLIHIGNKVVGFVLKLLFVMQTCSFFLEARRSGLLEMVLCTPVTDSQIMSTQWFHLRRLFLGPGIVFLFPVIIGTVMGMDMGATGGGFLRWLAMATGIGMSGMFIVSTIADFLALGWVGLWLSLSMKKPSLAPGLTVLIVLIAPTFLFCIPDIFIDVMLIAWARERLERDFRKRVSEQYAQTI